MLTPRIKLALVTVASIIGAALVAGTPWGP
jgi:hypothetical protein